MRSESKVAFQIYSIESPPVNVYMLMDDGTKRQTDSNGERDMDRTDIWNISVYENPNVPHMEIW